MKDPMEEFALPGTIEGIQDRLRVLSSTVELIEMQLADPGHRKNRMSELEYRKWRLSAQTSLSYTHQEIAFLKEHLRSRGVADQPIDPQVVNTVVFHLCRIGYTLMDQVSIKDREHLKAGREYLRACGLPILPEWEK